MKWSNRPRVSLLDGGNLNGTLKRKHDLERVCLSTGACQQPLQSSRSLTYNHILCGLVTRTVDIEQNKPTTEPRVLFTLIEHQNKSDSGINKYQ